MKLFTIQILLLIIPLTESFAQNGNEGINNSNVAFTIPEKDLLPENIAFDTKTESFFVGSTRKGKIIKIDKNNNPTVFIYPKQDGLWMVVGMKVDAKNRWLWVCSTGGENLIDYKLKDDVEGRPAGIFKFDLDSGKLINKYVFDTSGEVHFFNDLVLDNNGNVYITHMFNEHSIYTIQKNKDELEILIKAETLKYPNGITITNDSKFLFVAHSEGLARIEIASKKYIEMLNPKQIKIKHRESIDGLYFYNNTLIGIQPEIKTVQRFVLNEKLNSIIDSELLEVNHPMMNNPTTGVLVEDKFYYIANAQFGSFNKDGTLFPMEKLYEPTILKIKIND